MHTMKNLEGVGKTFSKNNIFRDVFSPSSEWLWAMVCMLCCNCFSTGFTLFTCKKYYTWKCFNKQLHYTWNKYGKQPSSQCSYSFEEQNSHHNSPERLNLLFPFLCISMPRVSLLSYIHFQIDLPLFLLPGTMLFIIVLFKTMWWLIRPQYQGMVPVFF